MRKTTTKRRPADERRQLELDPYVVQETTWTRDDLLRLRGMPVRHHPRTHRKAA